MSEVADLFATLGLKVQVAEWARGDAAMSRARIAADELGRRFMGAGVALRGVAPAAREAGEAGAGAGHQIAKGFDVAGAAVSGYLAYLGGHFAYDKLISSNQEYEDRLISLGAILQGNLNISFAEARKQALGLHDEFQRFDQAGAPATMREIAEFGKSVAAGVFAAKGSVKDLVEITEQGVIAGKVLAGGRNAGYASLEITEMLMGNVSNRMMMVRQLLSMIHMTEDEFRALDEKGRLAAVKKALSSPAMKDASTAFSDSFSGIETTIVSKFEIMARKVGLKVFDRLKDSLKGVIAWLDANEDKIQEFADKASDMLVTGFNAVTTAIKFLAEHGTLLKSILVALGAIMLATAVRAAIAWVAFLGPIGLIIAAVTALAYIVIEYWDEISSTASEMWDTVADGAHDAWEAIKNGFTSALEFISELPLIKQLLFLADKYQEIIRMARGGSAELEPGASDEDKQRAQQIERIDNMMPGASLLDSVPMIGPFMPAMRSLFGSSDAPAGPVAVSVSMGDIHVSSPNADAAAVAEEVNKTIGDHLGNLFRRTMDEVA